MRSPAQQARAMREAQARMARLRAAEETIRAAKALRLQRETGCTWADAQAKVYDDPRPTSPGEQSAPPMLGTTGEGA